MKNIEIRQAAKINGVFLYEIASKLNISEPTMTRLMRNELDPKKKSELLTVISELAAEKTAKRERHE